MSLYLIKTLGQLLNWWKQLFKKKKVLWFLSKRWHSVSGNGARERKKREKVKRVRKVESEKGKALHKRTWTIQCSVHDSATVSACMNIYRSTRWWGTWTRLRPSHANHSVHILHVYFSLWLCFRVYVCKVVESVHLGWRLTWWTMEERKSGGKTIGKRETEKERHHKERQKDRERAREAQGSFAYLASASL